MRLALLAAAFAATLTAAKAEPVPVIATFSILGDMVKEVGGDRVEVTTLVGPDGDGHVYQPTPADARAIRDARLVVSNGLGFEGWIDRLVEASGYDGPVLVATNGIDPIAFGEDDAHDDSHAAGEVHADGEDHAHDGEEHARDEHAGEEHARDGDHAHEAAEAHEEHAHEEHADDQGHEHAHGDVDPHAWHSLANARIYVANIADALAEVDPEGADTYAANRDSYIAEIDALEEDVAARLARVPDERRTVVTSHDAFGYLAETTGIRFVAPAGVSTDSDVSARDVARIIEQIREEKIAAVFVENVSDPRLVEQIAAETDAVVGGTLYSDALSQPSGDAPTYLEMMRHNIEALTSALGA